MTFDDILKLIPTIEAGLAKGRTKYQIAADAHAELEAKPSAFNIKPMKERTRRNAKEVISFDSKKAAEPSPSNGHDTEAVPA